MREREHPVIGDELHLAWIPCCHAANHSAALLSSEQRREVMECSKHVLDVLSC